MIDQALGFLGFSIVAAVTPGPSNAMIFATGAAAGVARGLHCVMGAAAGMAALILSVALGIGVAVVSNPSLLRAANIVGSLFLLVLAWRIATAPLVQGDRPLPTAGFWSAWAFQWLNPKGWLVAVSAVATFLHESSEGALEQAVGFAALFFGAALFSGLAWLYLGALLGRVLQSERGTRALNIALGGILALSVVFMFI